MSGLVTSDVFSLPPSPITPPMQGQVIILGFNSSIHGVYVILASALSANVTLNHLILMEKQRARRAPVMVEGGG